MKNVLYILSLTFLAACSASSTEGTDSHSHDNHADHDHSHEVKTYTHNQLKNAGIEWGKLAKVAVEQTINCNGVIDVPPQNKTEIIAPLGGVVKTLKVYPTEKVKEGQLLCTISGPVYWQLQQRFLRAAAQLEFAQADFDRKSKMITTSAVAEREFQASKSQYQQVKAEYEGAYEELIFCGFSPEKIQKDGIQSYLPIYSPTAGYITNINVNQGQSVAAEASLISIINKEHMHLELTVFEKDVARLALHQNIRFSLQSDTSIHQAEIFLIGESLQPENRSVNVHGHLHHEDENLKPGMYVNAQIITHADTVFALPKEAAIRVKDHYEVYVRNNKGEFSSQIFEVEHETEEYLVPTDIEKWKNKQLVLKGAYSLQEAEAGHSH